jgi:hypothetical protein
MNKEVKNQKYNVLSIVSFVVGIVIILLFACPISVIIDEYSRPTWQQDDGAIMVVVMLFIAFFLVVLSVIPIILGSMGLKMIKKDKSIRNGKWLCIAGIVMGVVGIVGSILITILFLHLK